MKKNIAALVIALISLTTLSTLASDDTPPTLAEFKKMSREEKADFIEGIYEDVSITMVHSKAVIADDDRARLTTEQRHEIYLYIAKLRSILTEMPTEVPTDEYGLVGELKETFEIVLSSDQKILGAIQTFRQVGCSMPDGGREYFKSMEEATAAGCEDNDVSWAGDSIRDYTGKELKHDDYMDWTGH